MTTKTKCRVCDSGPDGQRMHKCPNSKYYVPGSDPGAEYPAPTPFVHPTRDELLGICRDAFLPQEKWSDRDTARCQQQLGELYALLMAGCEFSVQPGHRGMMLDVRVEFRGFGWFEGGFDPYEDRDIYLDHEDYYAPTRERLDAVAGGDWYC